MSAADKTNEKNSRAENKLMKSTIIDKIRKALRLEKSNRLFGNRHEAGNCRRLIEKLRRQHNISEEISLDETEENSSELIFPASSEYYRRRRIIWQEVVFEAAAHFFGCRPLVKSGTNLKIVVGEKNARAQVRRSYLSIHEQAPAVAQSYLLKQLLDSPEMPPDTRRLIKTSFLHGFGFGLISRLGQIKVSEDNLTRLQIASAEFLTGGDQSVAMVPSRGSGSGTERNRLERKNGAAKSVSNIRIEKLDEEAFIAGSNFGWTSELPGDIADYAKAHLERIRDYTAKMQEAEERKNRSERPASFERQSEPVRSREYKPKVTSRPIPPPPPKSVQLNFNFGD